MALQELSPLPPVVGGAALGNAIAQGARDYAGRQFQLQDTANAQGFASREADKSRQFQLQDTANAQGFASREADKSRQFASDEAIRGSDRQLANTLALDQARSYDTGVAILIAEGYLDGSQRADKAAVADAYKRAQADGVTKIYTDLLQTPDPATGRPLLTVNDLSNPALVADAKNKLGQIKAKLIHGQTDYQTAELGAKTRAFAGGQAAADRALADNNALDQKVAALEAELNAPPVQPSTAEIVQRAQTMWMAAHPGERAPSTPEKLALEIAQATKDLQGERYLQVQERKNQIIQQVALLKQQQIAAASNDGRLISAGFFADPSRVPVAPARPAAPTAAAPTAASGADIASAIQAALAKSTPAPASPNAPAVLENPTGNATIDAGNAAIRARAARDAQAQLNAAVLEGQQIDRQLENAATPQSARTPTSFGPMGAGGGAAPIVDPITAAQTTADLLKKKAANEAKRRQLQAQLVGPAPATMAPPAVNTAGGYTPTPAFAAPSDAAPRWWGNGVPALQ